MGTKVDKTSGSEKSNAVANSMPKLKINSESTLQLVDHQFETGKQRKLQNLANDGPQVSQLIAFQEMSNNSSDAKQNVQLQLMANHSTVQKKEGLKEEMLDEEFEPIQKKVNNTGLPDQLKTGVENLSGYSMDDVKVHYNSDKPAQLNAHAYAQGTDIHVASGQEEHLPHEAWHVVQQMQGRVQPTLQMKGNVNVNDDEGLEKEADVMGRQAVNSPIIHEETTKQLKLNNTQVGDGTKQLISIESDTPIQFPKLLELIKEALPDLDKSLMGKLAKRLFKDEIHFDTKQEAIAYILKEGSQYEKAVAGAEAVKDRGDATEAAAAAIIGGQVNRGGNGRDVEWRMIDRETAEGIKELVKIAPGNDSDQELFEKWDAVRKTLNGTFNGKDLSKITSTPTDAFSSTRIAIAGGPAKFLEGSTKLKEKDANRVRELIKLANQLQYTPVLVFSATVTCEQCDAVASDYGIDVFHLEP